MEVYEAVRTALAVRKYQDIPHMVTNCGFSKS
jgi:hypothetical protein